MMKRKPLGYQPPNPIRTNNFLDSCAFDPKYSPEDEAALEIFDLYENNKILLIISYTNIEELNHPNTPQSVKDHAKEFIYTLGTSLNDNEVALKKKIYDVLTGNCLSNKMKKDAKHIFQASKYSGYFITVDKRLLKMKDKLSEFCEAKVLTPSQFLEIYKKQNIV